MKKTIAIILIVTLIFPCLLCCAENTEDFSSSLYPLCGVIIEINYEEDCILIEDFCGNVWEWKGIEDLLYGDIVAMIMLDNDTEWIEDDIILTVRYCGFIIEE